MLLLRSDLDSQESLRGYVLRVSAANGHPGSAWVLKMAGLSQQFARDPCDLTGLAGLMDKPVAVLEAAAYWPTAEKPRLLRFGTQQIRSSEIVFHSPRICPLCLADFSVCRRIWDLRCYAACHLHGCWMLDQCQTCGRKIDWRRQAIDHCHCGVSFSAAPAELASTEVSSLSTAIAELETNGACTAVPGSDLDGFLAAAWSFGNVAHAQGPRNPGSAKSAMHLLRNKMQAAAPVLLDWPHGLRDWLIAHRGDRPAQASMHSMFGNLLDALRVGLRGRAAFLVDQIGEILTEDWYDGVVKRNSYYYCNAPRSIRRLNLRDAARHLGVRPETIGRMVECGELNGKVLPAGKRSLCLFDAENLSHAAALFERRLTPAQASEYVGVSTRIVNKLSRAGLISTLSQSGHNAPHYFDPQSLDIFIKNLWRIAKQNDNECEIIPIAGIPARSYSVCEVLKRINTGQITAVRITKNMPTTAGLQFIGVREQDLVGARRDGRDRPNYTVREAADELSVSPRVILAAVRRGLIRLARPDQPHARCNIPADALGEFGQNYKMLRVVMHRLGINSIQAMELMRRAGYQPVIEADSTLGISSVWRAEDVAELLAAVKRRQN